MGSSCTTIVMSEAARLELSIDPSSQVVLQGYGNGRIVSLGSAVIRLKVDQVTATLKIVVVPDYVQDAPVLIGRTFSELPGVVMIKDDTTLSFGRKLLDLLPRFDQNPQTSKIKLRIAASTVIPPDHVGLVKVMADDYDGDLYVEAALRWHEGYESCMPHVIITSQVGVSTILPVINLSAREIILDKGKVIARAWPCEKDVTPHEKVALLRESGSSELSISEMQIGPVDEEQKQQLVRLLNEYRDCFAQNMNELGCAKTVCMEIRLNEDKPFTYRPYKLARTEQETVRDIITELLRSNIIRESDSDYCSPILLVKKKNGEQRMCVDFRKLNSLTIKDNHPLPRIDDQIDKLQGSLYFTSLDLRAGYYQIPLTEQAKRYTSFVTPLGQYEFNRMPFGLTNAPRVFQRFMNRILGAFRDSAAVYLDDVLLHSRTVDDAINCLRQVLNLLRREGLTLNLAKCSFLMTTVNFLGFDVGNGQIRPNKSKINAVQEFPTPKSLHQVRQFLGLTGYFRQFVRNYAVIARPLTALIRKNVPWHWEHAQEEAFRQLRDTLVSRPVLALFDPALPTEVHCDASSLGLAGILLQLHPDDQLHSVAYFSRQTLDSEKKYHSYELETLAVVETLKKFRSYLLGIVFTVVTDCNSLKATHSKKHILPRIARWWMQLLEFTFNIKYRPGERMKHVDALSRNPMECEEKTDTGETSVEQIMRIEQADWVLTAQLTDDKVQEIYQILSKTPTTKYERHVYKNYALRSGRVYRITAKGLLWVVPLGMRHRVVQAAHDDLGHFATEKTLKRLCDHYWFPRMRQYVERYIACCIPCLYNKRTAGKKEGFLHPPRVLAEPIDTIHVDHLGPFPKSRRGNMYILLGVDAFTKFVFLRAVKNTRTKYVIDYFKDIFATYGTPRTLVSDQGSCFTAKRFKSFCFQNHIRQVLNAVATPRANGQAERLNRVVLGALRAAAQQEEDRWDEHIRAVQFAINNTINKSTGKTPSQLLFGFEPRHKADALLKDEVRIASRLLENLFASRQEAASKNYEEQQKRKRSFDRRRKRPRQYKPGDFVLVEQHPVATGTSRKLQSLYMGPMIVKKELPNDRYIVQRTTDVSRKKSEKIVAVDRLRPWRPSGGISENTDDDTEEDGILLSEDGDTGDLED